MMIATLTEAIEFMKTTLDEFDGPFGTSSQDSVANLVLDEEIKHVG